MRGTGRDVDVPARQRGEWRPGRQFPARYSAGGSPAVGGVGLLKRPLSGPSFTYMTSSSRLLVPFLFNFCSSVMNINGVCRQAMAVRASAEDE
jgi:hypothetical protein